MQFLSAATILPVKNVDTAAALYRRLGFDVKIYDQRLSDGRTFYGFLRRGQIALHFELADELGRTRSPAAVYIYVDDPDALYAEWSALGVIGNLDEPEDKEWGVREMTFSDPDGNLLRIGRVL